MRIHIRSIWLAATAAAMGFSYASLPAQVGGAPGISPVTEAEALGDVLAFKQDDSRRMTVPVSIVGQGPFPFLVDTGAERTVISRELAGRLALASGKQMRIHGLTGPATVPTAIIPELTISKRTLTEIRALALAADDIGAAGILGIDSLASQRVVFDFLKKTMSIKPSGKRIESWGSDVIVVTGRRLYGRLILVNARIEGEKITVVIDTGGEMTIGNEALRRRLVEKRKLAAVVPVELISITGDRIAADYTHVRRASIGEMIIENMPIGFVEAHPFAQLRLSDRPAILLGMDVLRLFERVSVDFARKEVRFNKSFDRLAAQPAGAGILAATAAAKRSTLSSERPATLNRPEEAM